MWVSGRYSQRLLSLNPTTVMVVLLLGLWLLLGCDNTSFLSKFSPWKSQALKSLDGAEFANDVYSEVI